jgi:hypothetical protein
MLNICLAYKIVIKKKYEEITNVWNYDTSCMLTSLSLSNFKNFKCLIFVAHSVHETAQLLVPFYMGLITGLNKSLGIWTVTGYTKLLFSCVKIKLQWSW